MMTTKRLEKVVETLLSFDANLKCESSALAIQLFSFGFSPSGVKGSRYITHNHEDEPLKRGRGSFIESPILLILFHQ